MYIFNILTYIAMLYKF